MKINEVVEPLDLDYDKIAKTALGDYKPKIRFLGPGKPNYDSAKRSRAASVQQARTKAGEPMVAFKEIMRKLYPNIDFVFYNDKQATSRRLRAYIYSYPGDMMAYQRLLKDFRNNEDKILRKIASLMTKKGYTVKKTKYEKPISGIGWYSSRAGDPNIMVWIDSDK